MSGQAHGTITAGSATLVEGVGVDMSILEEDGREPHPLVGRGLPTLSFHRLNAVGIKKGFV